VVALEIVQNIFGAVWHFFTDVNVPGLNIPYSWLLIGVILIKLSITILQHSLGIGGGVDYRSGSSRNPKISDDRKGDEF